MKTGKKTARLLKRLDSNITTIANRKDDKVITSAEEINDVFKYFYGDLYTSMCTARDEDLKSFFQKVALPQLCPEEEDSLDVPLTEAEWKNALKCMKTGKSPGVDDFPAEDYRT